MSKLNSTHDEEGVSRTTGVNESPQYLLKIVSFSSLSCAWIDEYESDVFEASGYKWRLLFYPNGNGEKHISLYLELADTTSFPTGWIVHGYFKFFVYDHIRKNYLTIQAANGKKTEFNAMKTKSGFSKILSLTCFKDNSNGYLYNDSCMFGADIFVAPKGAMEISLSMIQPPPWNITHTWVIEKFSTINDVELYSEEFKVGKLMWKILLYPKGENKKSEHLSIFLAVSDCSSFPAGFGDFI